MTTTELPGQVTALTFDDGPNPCDTPRLLEVLAENHVKAVFCPWGDAVRQNPDLAPVPAAGRPESVVLMHDGPAMDRSGTVEAVTRVLPELRAEGWRFVQPDRRG